MMSITLSESPLAWLLLLIQARRLVADTPPLLEDDSGLLSWSLSVVSGVRELADPPSCLEAVQNMSGWARLGQSELLKLPHCVTWSSNMRLGQTGGTCKDNVPSKELTRHLLLRLLGLPSNCSTPVIDCSSWRQTGLLRMFLASPPDIRRLSCPISSRWNPWYADSPNRLECSVHLEDVPHE